jgi:DeoR/GlpR family transcriptional regulator of sugar metabolism
MRYAAEKAAVGCAAAALIEAGQTVLLDSGTTVTEVARAIPHPLLEHGGLTVVTRSLVIASELRRYRTVRLIVLGGVYQPDFDDFVGPQVETALNGLHVTAAVIGTDGIDVTHGLTTDNLRDAGLLRKITGTAQRVIVVADSSKIGVARLQSVLPLSQIHTFVTDKAAPQDFVDALEREGVHVVLAEPGHSR